MIIRSIVDYVISEIIGIRLRPKTIQMPITGKCNSRCATCNIWKQKERCDIDIEKLKAVLTDPYLSNVRNVGVNGGEPFLHNNIESVIETVISFPKLKNIYIISNGLITKRILENLQAVKVICDRKDVNLNLTISLDAINDEYSKVRGVPGGYSKVIDTINTIARDPRKYCSSLTIGTTVSRVNIYSIAEIRALGEETNYPINFHLAVPNRRIYTADDSDYTVFEDKEALELAIELFYGLFKYSSGIKKKLLYFQNYYYLKNGGRRRISGCTYKNQDITIDEQLNIYFCAKESYSLGNAYGNSIKELLTSDSARKERKRILSSCSYCGHYITTPTIKGTFLFVKELLKPSVWLIYRFFS